MITTAINRSFFSPMTLFLGVLWLLSIAGASLSLWALGLIAWLDQMIYSSQQWFEPLELLARQTHTSVIPMFPTLALIGFLVGCGSMAAAIVLANWREKEAFKPAVFG